MAREKKQKAVLPTNWLIVVGIACLFLAAAPCGYVWNKTQIHTLGTQIRFYELRLAEAKRNHEALERKWATMLSHSDLEYRVKNMPLQIGPPQPDQIISLPDMPAPSGPVVTTDEKLYAHRKSLVEEGRD